MPVFISYLKKTPPDSIQDFIKVYLQTKQIEVINWDYVMQLFKQETSAEIMSWINSGKVENMTQAKSAEFAKSLKPVCNVLAINLFRDSAITNKFIIDSIYWHIGTMPVKDSVYKINKYIPGNSDKSNLFFLLKKFSDEVIETGILN